MATALGFHGNVDLMTDNLSNADYQDLVVIFEEEGFPEDRADMRVAKICHSIAYYAGRSLKEGTRIEVADFLPLFWEERDKWITEHSPEKQAKLQEVISKAQAKAREINDHTT